VQKAEPTVRITRKDDDVGVVVSTRSFAFCSGGAAAAECRHKSTDRSATCGLCVAGAAYVSGAYLNDLVRLACSEIDVIEGVTPARVRARTDTARAGRVRRDGDSSGLG